MIRGYLDYAQSFRIYGWAFDETNPHRRVTVEIKLGDDVLGTAVADTYRQDLRDSGVGDGRHGFSFDFISSLDDNALARVVVHALDPNGARIPLARILCTPRVEDMDVTPSLAAPVANSPAQQPLFILGGARSGTSALAQAFLKTGLFWGQAEGHLLDLHAHLMESVRAFYGDSDKRQALANDTLLAAVPRDFLHAGINRLFADVMRAVCPGARWLDKTPNHLMIQIAPRLKAIWPEAQFIFVKRRAYEFVESRRRKFPHASFEQNCRAWAAAMLAWRDVRDSLNGAAIEVDQMFLARRPQAFAALISPFLGLRAVDRQNLELSFRLDQPERTGSSTHTVIQPRSLNWSQADWKCFERICGPLMDHFGYGRDDAYHVNTRYSWLEFVGDSRGRRAA